MRPTTKDLAKAAGVSLATVDRVLNQRPGVRSKTIEAVNEAIERIGFVRNLSAANLARGRTYRFEFLLPEREGEYLDEVERHIVEMSAALASDGVAISHRRALPRDPHAIANLLSRIGVEDLSGAAIMASETPQVRDAIARLSERGVHVVQFGSTAASQGDVEFVGVDNRAAGATAGRLMGRFCGAAAGKILVIAEAMNVRESAERRFGFDRVLNEDFPGLEALPTLETHGDPARTRETLARSLANHANIVGVYVASAEAAMPLRAIYAAGDRPEKVIIAHEQTQFTREKLLSGALDAVIAQDPGHVVRSAVRILKSKADGRAPLLSQERIRIEVLLKDNLSQKRRA